jgi:hypothetical protein
MMPRAEARVASTFDIVKRGYTWDAYYIRVTRERLDRKIWAWKGWGRRKTAMAPGIS